MPERNNPCADREGCDAGGMPEDQGMLDTLGNAVRLARSGFATTPLLSPEGDSVLHSAKRSKFDGRNPLAGSLAVDAADRHRARAGRAAVVDLRSRRTRSLAGRPARLARRARRDGDSRPGRALPARRPAAAANAAARAGRALAPDAGTRLASRRLGRRPAV